MRARLLVLLLPLAAALPAGAANQLVNPNFATDVTTGWTSGFWPRAWTGSEGATGLGAAQITATSAGAAIGGGAMTQCTTAVAGTTYDFGARFKIDPASTQTGGGRIRVTWRQGASCTGTATTDPSNADSTAAAGWQSLTVDNVTAPAGTVSVQVELIQSVDGAGTFQAFWDDVYFGPDPTPVELTGFTAE